MALLCTSLKAEMSACMGRQLVRRVVGILPFLCGRNQENNKFLSIRQKVVVLVKFRPQAAVRLQKQPVQRDDGCLFWHYFR